MTRIADPGRAARTSAPTTARCGSRGTTAASWEDLSDRFPGVPALTHVSERRAVAPRLGTVYVALDNHRETTSSRTCSCRPISARRSDRSRRTFPTDRPAARTWFARIRSTRTCCTSARRPACSRRSNKGQSWFPLESGLPTVPVYDLKIHPRDRELIAGTHGRGCSDPRRRAAAADDAGDALGGDALFAPAVAFEYGK